MMCLVQIHRIAKHQIFMMDLVLLPIWQFIILLETPFVALHGFHFIMEEALGGVKSLMEDSDYFSMVLLMQLDAPILWLIMQSASDLGCAARRLAVEIDEQCSLDAAARLGGTQSPLALPARLERRPTPAKSKGVTNSSKNAKRGSGGTSLRAKNRYFPDVAWSRAIPLRGPHWSWRRPRGRRACRPSTATTAIPAASGARPASCT